MKTGEAAQRKALAASRRWVVKIGSALATSEGAGLNLDAIQDWASQVSALRAGGRVHV